MHGLRVTCPMLTPAKRSKSSRLMSRAEGLLGRGSFRKEGLGLMRTSVWFEQNPKVLGGVVDQTLRL